MSWIGPAEREILARDERVQKLLLLVQQNPGCDANTLYGFALTTIKVRRRTFYEYLQDLVDANRVVKEHSFGEPPVYYGVAAYEQLRQEKEWKRNEAEKEKTRVPSLDPFILEK